MGGRVMSYQEQQIPEIGSDACLLQTPECAFTPSNFFSTVINAGSQSGAPAAYGGFIKWTSFLSYMRIGQEFGTAHGNSYLALGMPPVGTEIPLLGTTSTRGVTTQGIPLGNWEVLGVLFNPDHTGLPLQTTATSWAVASYLHPHSKPNNWIPVAQFMPSGVGASATIGAVNGLVSYSQAVSRIWCLGYQFPLGSGFNAIGNQGNIGATPYWRPAQYGPTINGLTTISSLAGAEFGYRIAADGNRGVVLQLRGAMQLSAATYAQNSVIAFLPGASTSRASILGFAVTPADAAENWHRTVRINYGNVTANGQQGLIMRLLGYTGTNNPPAGGWISFEGQTINLH
jgi:hypothetical protein